MQFGSLLEGRLLRRYKRFLADVELPDGSRITVHCPNTGAMTGCAEPGSRVWLSTSTSRQRKYPHTWELVETAEGLACIHSAAANGVVAEALAAGRIPGLENYPEYSREVAYAEGSRADLVLTGENDRVIVEIKSVTLCRAGGVGVFPDAVSKRALKHIHALDSSRSEETRSLLLFCVFHNGINSVSAAADIDPSYRDALAVAVGAGLEVQAWRGLISTAGIELTRRLPFSVDEPVVGGGDA